MANQLSDFYSSPQEWEEFIQSINIRKVINPYDKAWIQKIKRHYKTYGWQMNFYADQKRRLEMIKEELESLKNDSRGDKK